MSKLKVAAVFSNHCVLQRDKNIHIFGEGENGCLVEVTLGNHTKQTIVNENHWEAIFPPMSAQTGVTMKVSCNGQIYTYTDIAIGEVWLAGGQSNMEFELQNCNGGQECLKNDADCNVRFYYTQKNAYMDEAFFKAEENSGWSLFGEEAAKAWSAIGYFFAKRIAKELNVTVGVIGCNWGGTSASAWMSREALEEDEELRSYVEEYDKCNEGKSIEEQIKEYDEYDAYHKQWEIECSRCYEENPDILWDEVQAKIGPCKYPGPNNCKSPFRPAGLYECMLKRVMPYTLRGFLFYQGEADDHKPKMYFKLFNRMIRQWREDWGEDELPFLMVQLTMHKYALDPDFKNWPIIREAQMRTFQTVKNTGIAVIPDCYAFNDIHPKDKLSVGERLALQAMYHVYHCIEEKDAFGPIYRTNIVEGNEMSLYFDHAEDGFERKGEATGFELAGSDGKYVPAMVIIEKDCIKLSANEVAEPRFARYLWTNYEVPSMFGKNGLPMSPFRTSRMDDINSQLDLSKAKIQQIMEL